jgi:hypothetical protein
MQDTLIIVWKNAANIAFMRRVTVQTLAPAETRAALMARGVSPSGERHSPASIWPICLSKPVITKREKGPR